MKLNEVKEIGFYRAKKDERPDYIFEVIKNTDKEWLKDNPKATLLVDEWGYEYTDDDNRRHYETFGSLMQVQNADEIEVEKMTENFIVSGKAGTHLTEDKPTYKEKCNKYKQALEEIRKEYTNSIFYQCDKTEEECPCHNCIILGQLDRVQNIVKIIDEVLNDRD